MDEKILEDKELAEEDFMQVAAGKGFPSRKSVTVMDCNACGYRINWGGGYEGKGPYECPNCKRMELWGLL